MKPMVYLMLALLIGPVAAESIDNSFVRVTRGTALCASNSSPQCADRVVVALGDTAVKSAGITRKLRRGEVAVFGPNDSYAVQGTEFVEVMIKHDHPASNAPGEMIAAEKNALLFDGDDFFVFEEKLAPGDTRPRHSHSQRVVIQLNQTTLRQWPDNKPELLMEIVPDAIGFSAPVIHVVENVGSQPLRGVIIEFKPGKPGRLRR